MEILHIIETKQIKTVYLLVSKNDFHGFTEFTVLFPGMKDLDLDPPLRFVRPDIGHVR